MIKMRPYVPSSRIAVRDSIDEDVSDDVDDEVFIKDSRSAKLSEEKGVKRPLMAPRRRCSRSQGSMSIMKKHRRCWRCCEPFCYGLAAFTVLIALISLAALILTMFPLPLHKFKVWFKQDGSALELGGKNLLESGEIDTRRSEVVPCTQISVQKIWTRTFPRMNSESPVRKADVNGDGVEDIIFGFGVDDNIQFEGYPLPHCKIAQRDEEVPCEGGVIALNGINGALLWQSWSVANVFSLLCTEDVDRDGYPDCLAAGKLGMIFAISGRNGNHIWDFHELEVETNSPIVMDLYTINIVRDLDGDEVPEILAAHLEEREESKAGHIKVISGKTGKTVRTIPTPFREEVFVPLQVIIKEDGTELLLITTGGQNTPGGLYTTRLLSLMQFTSEKQFTPLFQNPTSGFMMPSVITDITGDHVDDIVVSSFNSTVYAFDGHTFGMLWNYTFPASEGVSAIVPGHFNHDNVPDFMIKYSTGPGFPVYYYSQTTILDGASGLPLLDTMMTDSGGSNSLLGGLSISQSFGGDFFLHWQMQCRGKYDAKDAYEFIPDSDIILQTRADTCRLRYNSSTVVKLYAIARHLEPPGAVIFSTDDLEVHLNRTQRPFGKLKPRAPLKHPKMLKKLLERQKAAALETLERIQQHKNTHTTHNYKENPLPNAAIEQDVISDMIPSNEITAEAPFYEGTKQNYPSFGRAGGAFVGASQQQLKDYPKDYEAEVADFPHVPEEYELQYNDNDVNLEAAPQDDRRPIRMRTKYPGNRDVRSDVTTFEDESNATQSLFTGGVPQNSLEKLEPLSLWDLEIEKEERDAVKESHKFDYLTKEVKRANGNRHRLRRLYQEDSISAAVTAEAADGSSSSAARHDNEDDDWFLASISSTGVLLKSVNNTRSSLDFAFALNIRESETYPPLFLPQDLICVDEKINAYKSYTVENLRVLRKQFMKQCLRSRLDNITPNVPKYESQLVVTRIGFACTCHTLQSGEVCSELDDIETQRWTEFMGNTANGVYGN